MTLHLLYKAQPLGLHGFKTTNYYFYKNYPNYILQPCDECSLASDLYGNYQVMQASWTGTLTYIISSKDVVYLLLHIEMCTC